MLSTVKFQDMFRIFYSPNMSCSFNPIPKELLLTLKSSRQEQQLKHDDAKTKQRSAEQDIQKQADA